MAMDLEHAIGCNVEFKNICRLHPKGKDYVKAVGGVVLVGDMQDPHEQVFLHGHDDFITTLAVSHNGRFCATGQQGTNANVILWDIASKRQLYCFEEQDHGIDCVCFSHDDQYLYSCSNIIDQRIMVYGVYNGLIVAWAQLVPKPTISLTSGGFVRTIKHRDTHEYLTAACGGKTIVLWHLDPSQGTLEAHQVTTAGKHVREFQCLAFVAEYDYLLAGTTSGDMAVILVKNRVVQTFVAICSNGVTGLVCLPTPEGQVRIIASGGDSTVTILSGPSSTELREERQIRLDGLVTSLSLSGDSTEVLAVSTLGSSWLVRCKDLSLRRHSQVSSGALYDVAYPAGISDHFLTCCGDGVVTLWDANDYTAKTQCLTRTRAYPIAVAGTEDIIVAGYTDGRLASFDCTQGQTLWHKDDAHKGGVTTVQLASNQRFVLTGGAEGEVRIWEMKTRDMMSNLKEHGARVNALKLFPSDEYAISASRDRCLLTWDLRAEKRLTAYREKHGGINCVAVSSNQTTVYTAGQEKTLTTWDLRIADPVRTQQLDEEIFSVALSPDDTHLVTAGTGFEVKLWDVATGMEKCRGPGHSRSVQKLAFAPDGKQVVSVGLDHSILVWNFYT